MEKNCKLMVLDKDLSAPTFPDFGTFLARVTADHEAGHVLLDSMSSNIFGTFFTSSSNF